ncbi:MAG TPA: STN and carboxypeptidase regulatory-like domain-containing protein, partial [Niastella sp.]
MKNAMHTIPLRLQFYAFWGIYGVSFLLLTVLNLPAQVAKASPFKTANFYQEKENKISLQIKNEKLQAIIEKIEKKSGYAFVYSNDEINTQQKLSVNAKEKNIDDLLSEIFMPLHIGYEIVKDKIILKPAKTTVPLAAGSSGLASDLTPESATAHVKTDTLIEGRVIDENKNGLGNVNIKLKGSSLGTTTNA